MEKLQAELGKLAINHGADLFGAANLTVAQDFICNQGGEYLRKFPRAISIGVRLLDSVVDELYRHKDLAGILAYRNHYFTVNSRLEHIALLLAKKIQDEDYQVYTIPASQVIDLNKITGGISHKLVANLAGLGWIGKNCLLITPDYGPRIRLVTILTDAPLRFGTPVRFNCDDCRECIDVCPVKAFTGIPFNPSETREARFNAHLCMNYSKKRGALLGEVEGKKVGNLCGLCVHICPYGRRSSTSK